MMKQSIFPLLLICIMPFSFSSPHNEISAYEDLGCNIHRPTFATALTYIENYQRSYMRAPSPEFLAVDRVQRADDQHVCFSQALAKTRDEFPDLGGTQFLYGLENIDDSLETERLGIFLPLDSHGDAMELSASQPVYAMTIPLGFHDPCPRWCD